MQAAHAGMKFLAQASYSFQRSRTHAFLLSMLQCVHAVSPALQVTKTKDSTACTGTSFTKHGKHSQSVIRTYSLRTLRTLRTY